MIKVVNRENVDVNLIYKGQPIGVKAKSDVIVSESEAEFLVGICGFLRKEMVKPLQDVKPKAPEEPETPKTPKTPKKDNK